TDNEIQVGAALSLDGGILLPTDAGQLTLVDMPLTASLSVGTPLTYSFRLGSSNVLTVFVEADGAGNLQNPRAAIASSIPPGYTLDVGGTLGVSGDSTLTGSLTVGGNTTLGDASTDSLTIQGSSVVIPNNLNFDNDTLYIDAQNNRVGIGTASPGHLLSLGSS